MILGKSLRSKFSRFVSVFMLVTAIKLLLYIAVMLLYVFINRKDAVPFPAELFYFVLGVYCIRGYPDCHTDQTILPDVFRRKKKNIS